MNHKTWNDKNLNLCDKTYVYRFFSLVVYETIMVWGSRRSANVIVLVLFVFHSIYFFLTNVKENMHFIDHGNFENWEIWVRNPQVEGPTVVLNEKFGIYPWWIIHHHYPPFNLKNVMQNAGSPHLKPNHRPFWHFGSFESSLDFELDRTKICPPKPKVLIVRVIRNV